MTMPRKTSPAPPGAAKPPVECPLCHKPCPGLPPSHGGNKPAVPQVCYLFVTFVVILLLFVVNGVGETYTRWKAAATNTLPPPSCSLSLSLSRLFLLPAPLL